MSFVPAHHFSTVSFRFRRRRSYRVAERPSTEMKVLKNKPRERWVPVCFCCASPLKMTLVRVRMRRKQWRDSWSSASISAYLLNRKLATPA